MDAWRIIVVFVFLVSVCIFSTRGSAGRQRVEELLSCDGNSVILDSQQPDDNAILKATPFSLGQYHDDWGKLGIRITRLPTCDEEQVEQLWINCEIDLMQLKEAIENLDISPLEMDSNSREINFNTRSLTENEIQKIMGIMPLPMKHTLLDCLSRKKFRSPVSGGEDQSKIWCTKYLEFVLGRHSAWRQLLASKVTEDSAMSPAVAPPGYSPASSPDKKPKISPPPDEQSLAEAPEEFLGAEESSDSSSGRSAGENENNSADSPPGKPSKRNTASADAGATAATTNSTIIASIVVTAIGTLLLSTCMFCCFLKYQRNEILQDYGKKDERPLLVTLSSTGSLRKSYGSKKSVKKDKFEDVYFKTKTNQNGHTSVLDINQNIINSALLDVPSPTVSPNISASSTDISPSSGVDAPKPPPLPLKPPPGRTTPPLKPPPVMVSPPPPGPPPPRGPRPPPPQKVVVPPHAPPRTPGPPKLTKAAPPAPSRPRMKAESDAPKTKLKPFFWDKVCTNADQSMVWNEIRAGSFQFNEEMIESLFGYTSNDKNKSENRKLHSLGDGANQYIRIIEAKKSQNLSILLKALNMTTEEVCDAIVEGNELPLEFLQTFMKMAPSPEEELKLRLYSGELSQLGPADRFLKAIIEIPFAFKRMDALLYMGTLQEELSGIKESFATIESACSELRNSRLFLKLLEAVLKTGNRMNDGTYRGGAQAFKLDTLLKLADVKGTDGKTTLLHFVVQEITRSEGVRALRSSIGSSSFSSVTSEDFNEDTAQYTRDHYRTVGLQVVAGLPGELENVKKAAALDADALASLVEKLGLWLVKTKDFLNTEMKDIDEENGFHQTLKCFIEHAEIEVTWLLGEVKRIRTLVKNTIDYFHGNSGTEEGFHLFVIVRDFMGILEKVCKEVKEAAAAAKKVSKPVKGKESPNVSNLALDARKQLLFPAIRDRRADGYYSSSSSDDDS